MNERKETEKGMLARGFSGKEQIEDITLLFYSCFDTYIAVRDNSSSGREDFVNQTFSVEKSRSRTSLCLSIAVFQKHDNKRSPRYQQNTLIQSDMSQPITKLPITKLQHIHLQLHFFFLPMTNPLAPNGACLVQIPCYGCLSHSLEV